jgi:spore maturation protein B
MQTIQLYLQLIADWSVPVLLMGIPLYALIKGIKVYEVFVEGAREGFEIGVRIMPFLVAILVAIGLFRDVGGVDMFAAVVSPITDFIRMPAEILPLAIVRPLSGSGAGGVMVDIMKTHGPDSYLGVLASVMYGSTETTFYIIAVYFGSVGIRKTRHAIPAGLAGDVAGALAAAWLVYLFAGLPYPG